MSKNEQNIIKRPKHLSMVDIAYQALVEAIVNQVFEPGTQINIDSLARDLHMSNTPIREALLRVMGEGFVKQKTNKGFIVTNFLNQEELSNLFAVRHLLETHALEIGTINPEKLDELDTLAKQMDSANDGVVYQDFKDYLHIDHRFHRTIVGLSENEFLIKAWEDLNVHVHLSRLYTGVGLFDRNNSSTEHTNVIVSLREDDRAQAVTHLSKHIRGVEKRFIDFLTRSKPDES